MDEKGKQLSKSASSKPIGGLKDGNTLEVGTYEVEVDHAVGAEEFTSGRVFLPPSLGGAPSSAALPKSRASSASFRKFVPPTGSGSQPSSEAPRLRRPAHNPSAPGALVIQDPFPIGGDAKNMSVPIVVDPCLARHMRPHQREGVKFLYECVEGRDKTRQDMRGTILADSMGLGKSLQSIALLWTLLKQGPTAKPSIERAIIVCPASLVGNWSAELKKWLGEVRLQWVELMSGQGKSFKAHAEIHDFIRGTLKRVLVISYELFRSYADDLYDSRCGLVICDEGHRLKSAQGNKTINALMSIPCRRRIILTGTPVQNDLEEYFAMCNFVNPACLGDLCAFRSIFATPILESNDVDASPETVRLGRARAEQLNLATARFVLRRTSKTLEKYLPPKREIVLFCRLAPIQEQVYERECTEGYASLQAAGMGAAFSAIAKLRKICCYPGLLPHPTRSEPQWENVQLSASGKLAVAMSLCSMSVATGDRVVLVSNFTSVLDVLERGLREKGLRFLRLDGSTPVKDRMDLVKRFNAGHTGETVFVLSAKAGGVGLNLIGANRLVLFDPDWNPATDLQTMARVWRDGQRKEVFVYRLLSTGTIEEKIYQRQLFKGELQDAVEGTSGCPSETKNTFSVDELKDLFRYEADIENCDSFQFLPCSRDLEPSLASSAVQTHSPESLPTQFNDSFCGEKPNAKETSVSDYVLTQVLESGGKSIVSYVHI